MQKNTSEINRLIAKTDSLWSEIRTYNKAIIDYLSDGIIGEDIGIIFDISLKLIISELLINKEKYDKYPIKKLTTDDFIQVTVVHPTKKQIDYKNQEECEVFIEEIRATMWGYIRQYYNDLIDLFLILNTEEVKDLSEKESDRLIECICVAYIETNFRDRELYFLERDFE